MIGIVMMMIVVVSTMTMIQCLAERNLKDWKSNVFYLIWHSPLNSLWVSSSVPAVVVVAVSSVVVDVMMDSCAVVDVSSPLVFAGNADRLRCLIFVLSLANFSCCCFLVGEERQRQLLPMSVLTAIPEQAAASNLHTWKND
jgi:hypothetical protein